MMLVSLSLLGVVAARIRSQHQLVIGQKQSSEVAVSATVTADVQVDTKTMKISAGDYGRFKKHLPSQYYERTNEWLYCPNIPASVGYFSTAADKKAYCRFSADPLKANVWTMTTGGWRGNRQQYQFYDQTANRCLMRQSCHSKSSSMALGYEDCKHCGTKYWLYDAKDFKLSEDTQKNCVQSDGHIRLCSGSYQKLEFVSGSYPGKYKNRGVSVAHMHDRVVQAAPVPPKFQCISRAEAIALGEQRHKTEMEKAVEGFENQMSELHQQNLRASKKASNLKMATSILSGSSALVGAIPVVGGVASIFTKAAGVATACAAEFEESQAQMARHELTQAHTNKVYHAVLGSTREIKLAIDKFQGEHKRDQVAMLISSISQDFLNLEAAAAQIDAIKWGGPKDLLESTTDLRKAFAQIRTSFAVAHKVNQFLTSMRQCIKDGTGQLKESGTDLGIIQAHKEKLKAAVHQLQLEGSSLRHQQQLSQQNRLNDARVEALNAKLAKQHEARNKADRLRRQESAAQKDLYQDQSGFTKYHEGVDCLRYTFTDSCQKVVGGKDECEGHCTNHHILGTEIKQRYRCRWQTKAKKHVCRSSSGENKYQKCKHTSCRKLSEMADANA